MQRGHKGKFFKNRPKSSLRLKGPKALWRKWHYPLISTHLTCKEWKWLWRKQRLQECPDGQVISIVFKVTQNQHFLKKVQRGDQEKFLKNRPKTSPRLKGLKALWRKWHYRLISMHLTWKEWKWFWRKQRLQECPDGQVISIVFKVTQNQHFLKKVQRGDQEKFLKNRPKTSPRLKGLKALWRKWHYRLISMHLTWKDWKRF